MPTLQTVEGADLALEKAQNKQVGSRRIRIERAKVNRTLFFAKLNRMMTNLELRKVVEPYGEIESVSIQRDHLTNRSKGFGFVKFKYREDAMDAFAVRFSMCARVCVFLCTLFLLSSSPRTHVLHERQPETH